MEPGVWWWVPVCIHTHCIHSHMWKYHKPLNIQTSLCLLEYQHYWVARQSVIKLSVTLINMVVAQSLPVHFYIYLQPSYFPLPVYLFRCTTPYILPSPNIFLLFLFFLYLNFCHTTWLLDLPSCFLFIEINAFIKTASLSFY